MPLMLVGPAFAPGGEIPTQYTCDGADISSRSRAGVFRHWAAFDIRAGARGLAAGYGANRPAAGFHQARNDFSSVGYGGPCPPKGRTHHGHFRLLAISRPTLDPRAAAAAVDVLKAAPPYVIGRTDLVGTYRR